MGGDRTPVAVDLEASWAEVVKQVRSSIRSRSPSGWSVQEVGHFLDEIGLPRYKQPFEAHCIDGTALIDALGGDCFEETCKELGVLTLHRPKLRRKVGELAEKEPSGRGR